MESNHQASSQQNAPVEDSKKQQNQQQQQQNQKKQDAKGETVRETGRGVVKAVPSGDTLFIISLSATQQGPPVERSITLSGITAPTLANRKRTDDAKDDPFAWPSREFLRHKAIGKTVTFTIEYRGNGGKEIGTVEINGESLSKLVVAEGWASVKRPTAGKTARPEVEELIALEDKAKAANKGIHSKAKGLVRTIQTPDAAELFKQSKGTQLTGVVESVRAGHIFRVALLPSYQEIMLFLSGVRCPEVTPQGGFVEPFGREARFLAEHLCLNRDVTVTLDGSGEKSASLYGTLVCEKKNVGEELLKAGLGQYVQWSGSKAANAQALEKAEQFAKDKKLRIWTLPASEIKNYNQPPPERKEREDRPPREPRGNAYSPAVKEFTAIVTEVTSGSTVIVVDEKKQVHKINFASIKVPRLGNPTGEEKEGKKEEKKEGEETKEKDAKTLDEERKKLLTERAHALEAKEFIRKRLIGQKVKIMFDYAFPRAPKQGEEVRTFWSVYLGKNNISVELVTAGLANVMEHRAGDESRSRDYNLLELAQTSAQKEKRGLFSHELLNYTVTDLTLEANKNLLKSKYFPVLQRAGKVRGVIEFEFSATRFKIFVPKENCLIAVSLASIRGPRKAEEPELNKKSTSWIREIVHQHDIEFDVKDIDKSFSLIGNVWVIVGGYKTNIATLLLEQGFARLYDNASEYNTEFTIAEEAAKKARKNTWAQYDQEVKKQETQKREKEAEREGQSAGGSGKQEAKDVIVTEIVDAGLFYVQIAGSEGAQLEDLMKNLKQENFAGASAHTPAVGELVAAQFTEDDTWYRALIKADKGNKSYSVFYVDYGNAELLSGDRIRQLPKKYQDLPAQAMECALAYIKVPVGEEEFADEAAYTLKEMVWNKTMSAGIEYKVNNKVFLSLGDQNSVVHVNAALLRSGLARLERIKSKPTKHQKTVMDKLREEEQKARQQHLSLWRYGDVGSDDEDDGPRKKTAKQEKPKPKPAENKNAGKKE